MIDDDTICRDSGTFHISVYELSCRGAQQNFLWGVYTLAGPTFIISLFLERLGVKNKIAIRLLFFSWFSKEVLCVFWTDLTNFSVLFMLCFSKWLAYFVGL